MKTAIARGSVVVTVVALTTFLLAQVAVALATAPDLAAQPQVAGQITGLPTPTPFRFVPATGAPSTTTTTTTSTAPRAGGFPVELALPALAAGLAAITGGSVLLRRKKAD